MNTSQRPGGSSGRVGSTDAAAALPGQLPTPMYQDDFVTLYCGDCRSIVPHLDESIDLLLTDPPYSQVRPESWDRLNQSDLCRLLDEFFALVAPKMAHNGAVYVFAWPRSAGIVEHVMSRYFSILNHIVWDKRDPGGHKNGRAAKAEIKPLRSYFSETERIIFAEVIACDQQYRSRTHASEIEIFRPLIEYFRRARQASGLSGAEIQKRMYDLTGKKYVFDRHAFSFSQWEFPAKEQFIAAATFLPLGDHGSAIADYNEAKAKYDALREQWEHLRRHHAANKRNYTDLWNYTPYKSGDRRRVHPCQKPLEMIRDMIETSSRPGALVLDAFAGSGQVGIAARQLGRRCILIEQDPKMCETIAGRLNQ